MTDKGKRAKVEEDEGSEALDAELVMNIEKLQEVQDELEKVNEEASDKVLEVEQKYNEIRRPVYNKRNQIIQNIPDFWLTAFLSHPVLCEILTEDDQKVFKYLQSLDVEDFKDVKSGYSITFTFKPNPYFEDTKLTKVFRFSDEGTISVNGTSPRWKDGMDLTNGIIHDSKEGNKRLFSQDSFFKWFKEVQVKDQVDGTSDEVADVIKEDLWPNPLKYFNNEADEEEYEDEEIEEEEEDGVNRDGAMAGFGEDDDDEGEDGYDEEEEDN